MRIPSINVCSRLANSLHDFGCTVLVLGFDYDSPGVANGYANGCVCVESNKLDINIGFLQQNWSWNQTKVGSTFVSSFNCWTGFLESSKDDVPFFAEYPRRVLYAWTRQKAGHLSGGGLGPPFIGLCVCSKQLSKKSMAIYGYAF